MAQIQVLARQFAVCLAAAILLAKPTTASQQPERPFHGTVPITLAQLERTLAQLRDLLQQQAPVETRQRTVVPPALAASGGTLIPVPSSPASPREIDKLNRVQRLIEDMERCRGAEPGTITVRPTPGGSVRLDYNIQKMNRSFSAGAPPTFGGVVPAPADPADNSVATSADVEYRVNAEHAGGEQVVAAKRSNDVLATAFRSGKEHVLLQVQIAGLSARQVEASVAAQTQNVPDNYNLLYDFEARAMRGAARAAPRAERPETKSLADAVPGLTIDYDEATQNPVRISSQERAVRLSRTAADSPELTARQFVREQKDLWQLDDKDVETLEVVSVSRQGLPTVRLIQRVDGVEVFQSNMTMAVSDDNAVISVTGQPFSGASSEPTRAAASRAASRAGGAGDLSAEEAIARAASDLTGQPYQPADFAAAPARSGRDSGPYRYYASASSVRDSTGPAKPELKRPVRVKDVLFPIGGGQFAPGYYIELWIEGYPTFSYVVDAVDTPDVLFRKNLTSGASFKYRVHNTGVAPLFRPEDGPAPGTPHPTGEPDGFQAATIPEKLIEIGSILTGRPWLPDGATTTRGNNCIAYADLSRPDGFSSGDVSGNVTAPGTFDTTYNHSKPATDSANLQASIVGMFFHVNWLHDRWYEAGFDEASGNAQEDNFGLGGLDGDPILAEGSDFSGTDNANMSTPADGESPVMQMFVFNGPSPKPSRTSNHEALITFHEMGHYITNRLVGNGSGLMNRQGRAMGEGWGDFFAVCMTSQDSDDFANGAFAVGGWTDLRADFNDNYYYSIRRYPYSADTGKSPLTFKHISANVVLPVGPLRNPDGGNPNNEEHSAGEVWCCALWEVFVNLVAEHGHAEGEQRMLLYVVGGLKLTPLNPTFLQARDAILTAAAASNPDDVALIWEGFAKRGMGHGAVGPASSSTQLTGIVESFSVPPSA
jgi:hypothetical protein